MGYRIVYQPQKMIQQHRRSRITAMTALFLLLFFLMVGAFWPEGKTAVQSILVSIRQNIATGYLDKLVSEMDQGANIIEAFSTLGEKIRKESCFAGY